MTYNQYREFEKLSIDELMTEKFFSVETAIKLFNECRRLNKLESPIGINCRQTAPHINAAIEKAEVAHYEG